VKRSKLILVALVSDTDKEAAVKDNKKKKKKKKEDKEKASKKKKEEEDDDKDIELEPKFPSLALVDSACRVFRYGVRW
jgi:hypothetical protein